MTRQHRHEMSIGSEVAAGLILQDRDRPQLDLPQHCILQLRVLFASFSRNPMALDLICFSSSDSSAIDALRTLESIPPTPALLFLLGKHEGWASSDSTVPDTMPAQK